jgi:CRISPR/Cas system Type II protein with McrA/HNH and RuvC-like nuclease domain
MKCIICHKNTGLIGKNKSWCESCWLKKVSLQYTGAKNNWLKLKNKLISQKYKCIYSGEKLILGINASIDHIIPKSLGGADNINNLQWVDYRIYE